MQERIEMAAPKGVKLVYVLGGQKIEDANEDGLASLRALVAKENIPSQYANSAGNGNGNGKVNDWAMKDYDWKAFAREHFLPAS